MAIRTKWSCENESIKKIEMNKFMIAGLGNIGAEYAGTRHNIGFDVVDELARRMELSWSTDRLAYVATGSLRGKKVWLIKPTTYMNLSGKAIQYWLKQTGVPQENLLVITDDISLDLGRLRTRLKGSDGGHNGLKSIQESLGNQLYPRMRFGIGRDFNRGRQVEFVLGKWKDVEVPDVEAAIDKAADAATCFVLRGVQAVMNEFNC